MPDRRPIWLDRRRFLAAATGTAVAIAVEAQAAPLLGARKPSRAEASNAWIEVDPAIFDDNLERIRAMLTGGAQVCAVMKADAYGIGIDMLMPSVIKARIPYVGIASNEEARVARACGFKGRIMRVRLATAREIAAAAPYDVEELVGNLEAADSILQVARKRGRRARVHLALNSAGMSRNGVELRTDAGRREALALAENEGLQIVGLMTHFPSEDPAELLRNVETFQHDAEWLFANTRLRREQVLLHAANSFAIQHVPQSHLDMVRPGGALYGYGGTPKPPFAHVAAFKTRVASVQAYPAGSTVSYDRTFTLSRDSLLANLPVGYSDGYRRAYSNKGSVLVRGQRAPVVGRVTMNTTMVDVTDIVGVRPDDEAVLFGRQGKDQITQAEIEEITGVILADQYTVWGNSNPKILRR